MTKEFVPHESALKLKELGFDEPCFANYTVIPEDKIDWFTIPEQGITDKTSFGSSKNYNSKSFEEEGTISAPTFSQAFRWFREEHNLFGCIDLQVCTPPHWFLRIDEISKNDYIFHSEDENYRFNTYEEAELACLDKLIEILTKQK